MNTAPDPHYRHRFPAEIIRHAVWLYDVFSLSFRDVELILAERGVIVSYESIRRWCLKFVASFAAVPGFAVTRQTRRICVHFQ
jgi:putative transposase